MCSSFPSCSLSNPTIRYIHYGVHKYSEQLFSDKRFPLAFYVISERHVPTFHELFIVEFFLQFIILAVVNDGLINQQQIRCQLLLVDETFFIDQFVQYVFEFLNVQFVKAFWQDHVHFLIFLIYLFICITFLVNKQLNNKSYQISLNSFARLDVS